jgi:hypothetical protein
MKDIDFDELDRAVNSLISPGTTPSIDPATTPALTTPASPAVPAVTTPPLAERRSSGRFMDVVHPSSDMRPVAVPPRAVEPEAVTTPVAPASPVDPPKPAAAWPDPIDVHEAATIKASAPDPVPAPTPTVSSSGDMTAPLESPFLSDAKVEKRPLGAFSNEVHESGPAAAVVTPKPSEQPAELAPPSTDDLSKNTDHPIQNDTPLPAELQPGLLSIESNEDPSKASVAIAVPAVAESTGPTSITQQYTEQASTGDKPTGTVFDTEAYKKPQTSSKKKKSGWLVVLWIFLLLVVGAGIGAAVYFFVLPRL